MTNTNDIYQCEWYFDDIVKVFSHEIELKIFFSKWQTCYYGLNKLTPDSVTEDPCIFVGIDLAVLLWKHITLVVDTASAWADTDYPVPSARMNKL